MEASNAQTTELKAKHAPELEAQTAKLKAQAARLAALPQDQRRQVLDDAGLKNVSCAPRPITPIQGLSRIEPLPQVPPPKWEKWRHMRDVELWEAVALSVNLEPDELPVYLGAYDRFGDNPFKICPSEFLGRLQIANSNGGIALPIKPVHTLKARCLVDLPTFGAWASNLWRDLPIDFPTITNTPTEPQATTPCPAPVADMASNEPDTSKGTPPKLTEADKAEILRLYNRGRGESVNALAKRLHVSRPTIDKVLQRAGIKG